ncbi:MAG: hypothetical protein MUO76_01215 [Anaerolineaceae bacterium]|nr:hypothetical protein [Anaerolineaceae bacterium]
MKDIDNFENEANKLLVQAFPPVVELSKFLVDIDEYINSDEYHEQNIELQDRAQNIRRDLKNKINQLGNLSDGELPGSNMGQSEAFSVFDQQIPTAGNLSQQAIGSEHNPKAAKLMDDAEKFFYGGRYAESVKLYDQVLQIEPMWERASQHRTESEEYLRTGYIPSVALPPDAASAFGKAQSAARVGRYMDAQALLERAKTVLRDVGIQRWQEGQEFEQKLQQNIDAELVYQEGVKKFNQGNLEEGIEKVETAAQATGLPKYKDKAQELRKAKETIRVITEVLYSTTHDPKMIYQVKTDLDILISEYGDNVSLQRLKSRLELSIPRIVGPLREQARALKNQAERSQTLESAQALLKQAKQFVEQVGNLEGSDEFLEKLQNDIEKLSRDLQRYEDDLVHALDICSRTRGWPANASRMSEEVRRKFPNDPRVVELNKFLSGYHIIKMGLRILLIIIAIGLFGMGILWTSGKIGSYLDALTPSPTATATNTATPTATATATATVTPTRTNTPTATMTPTPVSGMTVRNIYARNGCYETFTAIDRIPEGSFVRFLPSERRFDNYSRECVLVEYQGQDKSVIGWILLGDLSGN